MGFTWSFYGFFLFAALWVGGYFLLARWINKRERKP